MGIFVIVLVVVVAAALWWLASSAESLVESAIEDVGTELLGTPVRVGGVSLDLSAGRGEVRRLRIANPKGFSSNDVLAAERIVLDLDVASLTESPLVLDEVSLDGLVALFEVGPDGVSNVDTLTRRLSRGDGAEPEAAVGPPTRLRIRRLSVEGGRIIGRPPPESQEEAREIALPAVRMRDVGGASGGTPSEIGRAFLLRLTRQVAAAAARDRLGRYLEEQIDEHLEGAGEAAKGILRSVLGTEGETREGER